MFTTKTMLVTKLSTSFQQICQDRLFSGGPYMTLFNFGAIRCASGNTIHFLPVVIEFGTVGIPKMTNCIKHDVFSLKLGCQQTNHDKRI